MCLWGILGRRLIAVLGRIKGLEFSGDLIFILEGLLSDWIILLLLDILTQ